MGPWFAGLELLVYWRSSFGSCALPIRDEFETASGRGQGSFPDPPVHVFVPCRSSPVGVQHSDRFALML